MTATGEHRVWEFSNAPLGRLSDGRRMVISMAIDVTEREQAEDALARERNLLRTLMDHLPDHIFVKDTDSRFIAANKSTLTSLGVATEDVEAEKTIDAMKKYSANVVVITAGSELSGVIGQAVAADIQERPSS